MTISQWLAGSTGQIFASACVMTILVLMLFMAFGCTKAIAVTKRIDCLYSRSHCLAPEWYTYQLEFSKYVPFSLFILDPFVHRTSLIYYYKLCFHEIVYSTINKIKRHAFFTYVNRTRTYNSGTNRLHARHAGPPSRSSRSGVLAIDFYGLVLNLPFCSICAESNSDSAIRQV